MIYYVAGIILPDGRAGCLLNDNRTLSAWKSKEEACGYFTRGYESKRGYEGRMSGVINWLTIDFRVFEIEEDSLGEYFDVNDTPVVRTGNVSGSYLLAIMKPGHESIVENGTKPSLLSV